MILIPVEVKKKFGGFAQKVIAIVQLWRKDLETYRRYVLTAPGREASDD